MKHIKVKDIFLILLPLLCIVGGFLFINGFVAIGNCVQKNTIEKNSAAFPVATDCKENEGGIFIYNGIKYSRIDHVVFKDWIPKETDPKKGVKTKTLTAYGIEDDINSFVFEVQVVFFDNYYCCSENIVFPEETDLPDRILLYCNGSEIIITERDMIGILISMSDDSIELLKQYFPDINDQSSIEIYADWYGFPLMKRVSNF